MSEQIKITGTVETVLPLETFESGFTKRVLVVNTGGEYAQTIPVEFVKDKTEELDGLANGDQVVAFVNLRGNEYKGRYYANIQGWRLDKGSGKETATAGASASAGIEDEHDDIPF